MCFLPINYKSFNFFYREGKEENILMGIIFSVHSYERLDKVNFIILDVYLLTYYIFIYLLYK